MADSLGTDPDVEKLAREARRAGWTVEVSGSNHLHWEAPDGHFFTTPLTGSSRTVLRVRSRLRQLDPAAFGKMPLVSQPSLIIPLDDLVGSASQELEMLTQLLAVRSREGDPIGAAEVVRAARRYLDEVERQLRQRGHGH